jgi:non-homologous end joining protein Ku
MQKALDAAIISLDILTSKDVPDQLITQEMLDLMSKLLKQVLVQELLPLYDDSFRHKVAKKAQSKATDDGAMEEDASGEGENKKFWKAAERDLKFLPNKVATIFDK